MNNTGCTVTTIFTFANILTCSVDLVCHNRQYQMRSLSVKKCVFVKYISHLYGFGGCVNTKNGWRQTVARVVKSEMSVRGVKYQALSQRLQEIGVEQSADNLRNKVNKGIMGADLFLQIMMVLNARPLAMQAVGDILNDMDDD